MAKEKTTDVMADLDDNEGWEKVERFKFKKAGESWQGIYRGPGDPSTFKYIGDDGKEMLINLWRLEISRGEFIDLMGDYKIDDFFSTLKRNAYEVRVAFKGKESIKDGKQQLNGYDIRKRPLEEVSNGKKA